MYGWTGLMDGSNENNEINLKKEYITKENINNLFKKTLDIKQFKIV